MKRNQYRAPGDRPRRDRCNYSGPPPGTDHLRLCS